MEYLYENEALVIINKPSGQSLHNDDESVSKKYKDLITTHRIDKMTSGCLILAKNTETANLIMKSFEESLVQKTYEALVFGKHSSSETLVWDSQLGSKPGGFKEPRGPKPLVSAETSANFLASNQHLTHLELKPKTGRTHQIRKHCAIHLAPIVGDSRYADQKANARIKRMYDMDRMFLHAARISFEWKKELIEVSSPIPADFSLLMNGND